MSDEAPADTTPAQKAPPPRVNVLHRSWDWHRRRMAHWLEELLIVFVGVYAAFFLNYRSTHRQERHRHAQLLAWVEDRYTGVLDNAREQAAVLTRIITDFKAKLAAGQTPEIKPIGWTGDYDAADSSGLLQSGGYDLLDVETIRDIREAESALRQLTSIALRAQGRSDALILPNRGKDPAIFYDPTTHRLRENYDWVPQAYEDLRDNFVSLQANCTKLLAQVRAEREHGL